MNAKFKQEMFPTKKSKFFIFWSFCMSYNIVQPTNKLMSEMCHCSFTDLLYNVNGRNKCNKPTMRNKKYFTGRSPLNASEHILIG